MVASSNHEPISCTVSEINGDFNWTSQIFSTTPVYLTPPLNGFPFELELGTNARGHKTRMIGLPDGQKSFKIGLAV